jgi:KAP family P-loop domain
MADATYALLNDQPINDNQGDLLDTGDIAEGIASMLVASRASSPFVLAVDASWGMGKSSLLRQIESHLRNRSNIVTLRFNAWTADGENALEGLIKSVLGELDPNTVRRWVRRAARQQHVMLITRIGVSLVAHFFGMARLVDELWTRMGGDSKSRNEMRDLIHGMLSDWISQDGRRDPGRALAVFIDDLDRCSEDVVIKVCEAVKLYLDVPGLIFVLACDQSVLARGVASSARGGAGEGRMYLEKIVQVVYRMALPEEAQVRNLIRGYARQSGTSDLIDENVAEILARGSGRNPRKIKRIINSFVLEYELNPSWRMSELGSEQLVRAVLLQQLYSSFYELLVREDAGEDPVGAFLDYIDVRNRVAEPPTENPKDPWWDKAHHLFQAYRLMLKLPAENMGNEIKRLEAELPDDFLMLAQNSAFITLLNGIGDSESRKAFRGQLIRRPLATARVTRWADSGRSTAEWPGPEWEKLSDVDYWAELASDKPLSPRTYQPPPAAAFQVQHPNREGQHRKEPRSGEPSEDWFHKVQGRDETPSAASSLADAVQAAHAEGFSFGQTIAQEAPALWLEAVLARKPRMPSDLEARLLQGSALSIDALLHDEVRHALRRGFWDALERSRR